MTDLPVNQIYFDFIWEGQNMGTHALFVRLQGCASECVTCETPAACDNYGQEVTVDQMLGKEDEDAPSFAMMTELQILMNLKELQPPPYMVQLCGGDPAFYDLLDLTEMLADAGYTVQVQTRGAIPMAIDMRTRLSVRPNTLRVAPGVLVDADEVIFEVRDRDQLKNVSVLLEYVDDAVTDVFLTPAFDCPKAIDLCMEEAPVRGFRVSYRPDAFCVG